MSETAFTLPGIYGEIAALRHQIREAKMLGAQFRVSGHGAEIGGLDKLPADLRTALEAHRGPGGILWEYLNGDVQDAPSVALLEELGVEVVLVETWPECRRVLRQIITDLRTYSDDGAIAADIETAPKPEYFEPSWTKLNQNGALAAKQPKPKSTAGINPHLSTVACMSIYAGGKCCFVFRNAALQTMMHSNWFWKTNKLIHNSTFELKFWMRECSERFLPSYPRKLGEIHNSMQAVGLLEGVGDFGGEKRSLPSMAALRLRGLVVLKDQRASDWAAPVLSPGQVAYSGIDAVVPMEAWPKMRQDLHAKGRWKAYELQRDVGLAIADIEYRGVLVDLAEHSRQSAAWALDYADACERFTALTGDPPPLTDAEIRSFLRKILTPGEIDAWPTTPAKGDMRVTIEALRTLAHRESVRVLIDVHQHRKMLSTFGPTLAEKVCPTTGRLHPSFNIAATKAGRFSSSGPNFQQTPNGRRAPGFRNFISKQGYVLIGADYNQIELRVLGEVHEIEAIRRVYAETDPAKRDIHRWVASQISRTLFEDVDDNMRGRAKAIIFGIIFGMGPPSLAGYAYSNYGIIMNELEARSYRASVFEAFHPLENVLREHTQMCQELRAIPIGIGRVVEQEWEFNGKITHQQCCNVPVQGAAADVMLAALILVYEEFRRCGIRGGLIATIHDEILVEVHEDDAERARALLETCMIQAFAEYFTRAPLNGLVEAKIGRSWGELK